jgi:hypothetical protein
LGWGLDIDILAFWVSGILSSCQVGGGGLVLKGDLEVVDFFGVEGVDGLVGFVGDLGFGELEFFEVVGNDFWFDFSGSPGVVLGTGVEGGVEEDQVDGAVVVLGQVDQFFSIGGAQVGGVGDGEAVVFESEFNNFIHKFKGIRADSLVGGVVADDFPALVGADNLCGLEKFLSEVGFSAAGRAAKDDQGISKKG